MDQTPQSVQEPTWLAAKPGQTTDRELAAQVLRKDRKATADFVNLCADRVYAYVRRRLMPRTDLVEDLVQEIFLAAWENLATFRGDSSLQNWILGIARHKVESYYRDRLREVQFPADEEDRETRPLDLGGLEIAFEKQELEHRVRTVLGKLPEAYSAVLLWRYWEKRSLREMADQTCKTEKAIERLLARARDQFKKEWNER